MNLEVQEESRICTGLSSCKNFVAKDFRSAFNSYQFQNGTSKKPRGFFETARIAELFRGHLRREKMSQITPALISECRSRLLQTKAELLNRVKESRMDLHNDDKGGDEADQTVRVLAEAEFLSLHERLRSQLMEIESALARIENGSFGVCEETEEMIEPERLRAIPWTRLSIEGAEIRESMTKRYARGG